MLKYLSHNHCENKQNNDGNKNTEKYGIKLKILSGFEKNQKQYDIDNQGKGKSGNK